MDLQRNLEASVEKRTKETYGPPMGKRLLIFMDDLNMPKVPSPSSQPSPLCDPQSRPTFPMVTALVCFDCIVIYARPGG